MNKQLILAGLTALSYFTYGQFLPGGAIPSTDIYRDGKTGFGMTTAPITNKVEIETFTPDDGLMIYQRNSTSGSRGSAALFLKNTSGRTWGVLSTGQDNNIGGSHFAIYDINRSKPRFFISGTTGNTGIGTTTPDSSRLHVYAQYTNIQSVNVPRGAGIFETSASQWGTYVGGRGKVNNSYGGGVISLNYGLIGEATCSSLANNRTCGVQGTANGGNITEGGHFEATGSSNAQNIGVYAIASGASNVWYNWAGYFDGKVDIAGDLYHNGSFIFSDRRFKKDIKRLENTSEKLGKLSGYTYSYKSDEFKEKRFDDRTQIGLIAQEVKEVFPELIREDDKGYYAVNYQGMIPVLLEVLKEQIASNEARQKLIEEQARINSEQQKQINELMNKTGGATGINQATGAAADGFALEQNIPNPFSQETVINYNLPQQVNSASLVVYDLSGKQIASFPITEKGASSITITSDKLAAGIYIYSVMADGRILDSKRMVVAQKQ
jgi:hypothetical protein